MSQFKFPLLLAILLSLNLSCAQTTTENRDQPVDKPITTNPPKLSSGTTSDTLAFTSGVLSVLQDSKGNYWLGSHQEGVCLYDGKTFTPFTVENGLSSNQILSIQESQDGRIWFGTGNGLSSYQDKKFTKHSLKSNLNSFLLKKENNWEVTEEDLWFDSGDDKGVYRYNGQALTYLIYPAVTVLNKDNIYNFTGFAKGKDARIWIATYAGVFGYDGKNFTIINDESLDLTYETGYLHVRSILEDSKGNLWIGNNGIGVLLHRNDSTINFSEKKGLIHPSSSRRGDQSQAGTLEHVFAIEEDRQGNIWFGDRDTGAWKYDGKTMTNYTMQDGLPSNFVLNIYKDKKGVLWFGTTAKGLYQFQKNAFKRVF
ncbi:MAG: two-component regulator propeller domain-containing protein [Saprospiraceae bacterium]